MSSYDNLAAYRIKTESGINNEKDSSISSHCNRITGLCQR